jgi:hypothetical protein
MKKRLDLSGFMPSRNSQRLLGEHVELCVRTIGGGLWDTMPGRSPEAYYEQAAVRLPGLGESVRRQLHLIHSGDLSLALVDWTALARATTLLEAGAGELDDPFLAFADFSAVLSAVLFYDRLVVLDNHGLAARANSAFGLGEVISSIDPGTATPGQSDMARLLDSHYSWAWHLFNDATTSQARWIAWLAENWDQLLPGALFPSHHADKIEADLGYNTSPDRKSWIDILFRNSGDAWQLSPASTHQMILDNDLRALIYQRLAQTLEAIVSDADCARTVRYVGGCLRTPLILARQRFADACLEGGADLPVWLQDAWGKLYRQHSEPVQMPFWTAALLSKVSARRDLAEAIGAMRQRAETLRARRAELDEALREGRADTTSALMKALAGDAKGLMGWLGKASDIAAEVVRAGADAYLKTQAPGVPTELVTSVTEAGAVMGGSEWLSRQALRLFRPHFYFVLTMSRDALVLQHTIRRAASVFDLGGRDSSEPVAFLQRLGQVTMTT